MNKNEGDFKESLTLVPYLLSRISAGFPSPADDYIENNLSLSELLIKNHLSTFLMKTSGDSMMDAGH
jgi:DNA polymerase V